MSCPLRNLPVQLLAFFFLGNIATAATALDLTRYSFKDQLVPSNKLPAGWSLISVGDTPMPTVFNNKIGMNPPATGTIPSNLTTLWAWDNAAASWYFYAPSLDANGTLANYITTKNYLGFGAKTLDPTMGFGVNHP